MQSQREPETLIDLLRVRAESQAEKNAYTFLIDGEAEETSLTYGRVGPARTRDRRPASEPER